MPFCYNVRKTCLVFEDAPKGIVAAKKASMCCVAVPNPYLKNRDYFLADAVVETLEVVDVVLSILFIEIVKDIKTVFVN